MWNVQWVLRAPVVCVRCGVATRDPRQFRGIANQINSTHLKLSYFPLLDKAGGVGYWGYWGGGGCRVMEPAKGHSLPLATCHTTKANGGRRPAAPVLRRQLQRAACGCWWLTSDQIMSWGPKLSLRTFARFKATLRFFRGRGYSVMSPAGRSQRCCARTAGPGGPWLESEFINKHLGEAAAAVGVDVGSLLSGRPILWNQSALQGSSGAAVDLVLLARPISWDSFLPCYSVSHLTVV